MPGPDCITRFFLLDRENRSDLSVPKSGTRAGPNPSLNTQDRAGEREKHTVGLLHGDGGRAIPTAFRREGED
jgi:hypothetical protein